MILMKVEYDMEKEKRNLKKKMDKILKKFPDVGGLDEVLDKMLALVDSKPFKILTKNLVNYTIKFNEIHPEEKIDIEVLWEEFPVLKYAIILDRTKDNSRSIFSRPSDTVTYTQFVNFISFIIGILAMKEGNEAIYSEKRIYNLSERVMFLLDDFDKDISFDSADEDFFISLDAVKWNKDAKKLSKKMIYLLLDIAELMITTIFSDIRHDVFATYRTVPIFLAACSAFKNDRNTMEYEDVICAFNTFYKLIDADLDDLI